MSPKQIINLSLRLPADVHEAATRIAKEKNVSLNQLITDVMADFTETPVEIDFDIVKEFRQRIEALEKAVFKK